MDLLDLKRWHWMLIGLIAGGLWSASRLFYGFDLPNDDGPITLQRNFAWFLVATEKAPAFVLDEGSNVYLTDLRVHPPVPDAEPGAAPATRAAAREVQWVTGLLHRHHFRRPPTEWSTSPFRYKAELPVIPDRTYDPITQDWIMNGRAKRLADYKPAVMKAYATVQAYFDEIHRKYGSATIPYRYCWWESRGAILTIYPLGGVLVIGVFWPTLLSLLTASGLAAKKKPGEYDMTRFRGAARPGPSGQRSNALTAEEERRLAAVTAEYEKGLQPANGESRNVSPPAALQPEPAIRHLAGDASPQPAAPRQDAAAAKAYGADTSDYYPTEIHKSSDPKDR